MSGSSNGAPPAWFTAAIAMAPRRVTVTVRGARIRAKVWDGTDGAQTLLLIHGGAAHAGWWHHLAPSFLPGFRVVAVDLSGHGDSDRRARYSFPVWAEEVLAVAASVGGPPPVIVGHSMGGVVAALAATGGAPPSAVVIVDTPLHEPRQETIGNADSVFSAVKTYPDRETAVGRFRLLPDQPVVHPALVRHVGEHSVCRIDAAWGWKFDPAVFARPADERPPDVGAVLAAADTALGAIVGGASDVVPAPDRDRLRRLTAPWDGFVELQGGHHHLMFDRPRALADAVLELCERFPLATRQP